jgi:hypothetical protein
MKYVIAGVEVITTILTKRQGAEDFNETSGNI